jgi:hypothetical protein
VDQLQKPKIVRITKRQNEKRANLENQNVAEKIHEMAREMILAMTHVAVIVVMINVMIDVVIVAIAAITVAHNSEKKITSIRSLGEILLLKRSVPEFLLAN